jgi:hypothetical protein
MIPDRLTICASHLVESGNVKGLALCGSGSLPTPCRGVFLHQLSARSASVSETSALMPGLLHHPLAFAVEVRDHQEDFRPVA